MGFAIVRTILSCPIKLVFSTLLCLIAPILFLMMAPIYIFRWIVFHIAPYLRPRLGKMLTTRSTVFAVDDMYNKPNFNVIVCFTLSSNFLSLDKVREEFTDKILNAKNSSGGLLYPELKQSVTSWLGFLFWKPDPTFNLEDHITLHEKSSEPTNDMETVKTIIREMSLQPFKKGKCLWEIKVLWNFLDNQNEKFFIIFYLHLHL